MTETGQVVQLTPGPAAPKPEPVIHVTPKAIAKIRQAFQRQGVTGVLRLGVLGGGCSGLSYQFKFDTKERPTDKVFEFGGVRIVVDPKSLLYLHGMTLDYKESLMQSGFVFENPNAQKSCGCGTSFSA
ncbi:MAG TPA: iron-sulfur cluster assembly accessory protein [Bryobacteraceae bacterium]|nr:iron-sulfur cluster assembly accessory protein [Bryobacteraceae bacterium]